MNRLDVEMLQNSMNGLGKSFQERRQEEDQNALKQQMLDAQLERGKAEQTHYSAEELHYKNQEQAQSTAAMNADDQKTFQVLTTLNASGALANRDQVNKWLSNHPKWGKVGLALQEPTQKPVPQVGQSSVAQALKIAEEKEAQASSEDDPEAKAQLLDDAKILRDSARQTGAPKVDPGSYDTERDEYPEVQAKDADPGSSGILGLGSRPAVPAVPYQPKRVVTRKIPHNAAPTSGTATTADPNVLRQQAQQAITGGKDANAVRQRFKQITGQDL